MTYTNATTLEAQVLNSLIAGPDAEDQDDSIYADAQ